MPSNSANGEPPDAKTNDDAVSSTRGLDDTARRRISYVLLGFGICLLAVSVGAILAKADIAKNAIGIPIATGLTIVLVGFLGGRAGWQITAIGLSLGGSIAAFAGVYKMFFYDATDAECAFSLPCKAPMIALQFVHPTGADHKLSGVIMNCLEVTSGLEYWDKVEIKMGPRAQTIPNGNQYFLHRSNMGLIDVGGKADTECLQAVGAIRLTEPDVVYRMQRLWQSTPQTDTEGMLEVTYLHDRPAGLDDSKTPTKQFRRSELIVMTVYLAPTVAPTVASGAAPSVPK
jgi:hypothetical protein